MLATLGAVEYDRYREGHAKNLGIRVSTLDQAVAKIRSISDDQKSDALVDEAKPWSEPVDGNEVLSGIEANC